MARARLHSQRGDVYISTNLIRTNPVAALTNARYRGAIKVALSEMASSLRIVD